MDLKGQITFYDDGMGIATRAMQASMKQIGMHGANIANYGVPGYHRKLPVVTRFAEYLGADGIDESVSTEIGRIRRSDNPLDFALKTPGFFQTAGPDGTISMSRDGRMKLDEHGNLLSLGGQKVLSDAGTPVQLPFVPQDLKHNLKMSPTGEVSLIDPATGATTVVSRLGIVNQDGSQVAKSEVRQGYVEDSNVMLAEEFTHVVPLRRQFEANRQLFIIQSDILSRTVQELGRPG